MKIREAAEIELTHVLVLYDDPDFTVLPKSPENPENPGPESPENLEIPVEKVYDFDLMEEGGHVTGYKISDKKTIADIIKKVEGLGSLLVGDGNHSLAAAKSFWEQIKGSVPSDHPARYALVELVNIHDPGLIFEPIHRIVKGVEPEELFKKFNEFNARLEASPSGHSVTFVTKNRRGALVFDKPEHELEVESLDKVIDAYSVDSIEYEHDPEMVEKLGKEQGNIGFFLPPLNKSEFFSLIKKKGVLPKKTFSLGEEKEKRYYIEARKIVR